MIGYVSMSIVAGAAIAPSVITGTFALGGVVLTVISGLVIQWRSRVHERKTRWNNALRAGYAETFAAFDDLSDAQSEQDALDSAADDYKARFQYFETCKNQAWARLNLAMASVDLLAPQEVCDKATEACALAHRPNDDPQRVAAMEGFVTATRKHLGIKPHVWKQKVLTQS